MLNKSIANPILYRFFMPLISENAVMLVNTVVALDLSLDVTYQGKSSSLHFVGMIKLWWRLKHEWGGISAPVVFSNRGRCGRV
jgi:hypothetical protein